MTAFTFRMPAGIPGEVNRANSATVETQVITPSGTTGAPTAYGCALLVDATTGNMRTVASSTTDTMVYGLLARPFPTNSSQDATGTSTPPAAGPCNVLRRGYMHVLLSGPNAATKGGQVYFWNAVAASTHIVGGFEAGASSAGMIAIANTFFQGPADAGGITEIGFNI